MFFGLGKDTKVDKVEVIWYDGKVNEFKNVKANKTITAKYVSAKKANLKLNDNKPKLFRK